MKSSIPYSPHYGNTPSKGTVSFHFSISIGMEVRLQNIIHENSVYFNFFYIHLFPDICLIFV